MKRIDVLPRPYPDKDLWDSIRDEMFRSYPERKANYLKFQNAERGEVIDYLPVKMDFENVSRCNFRCSMCQVSGWENGQRASDMPLDRFKSFIDNQYGLVEIKIQGMGEPLLGKSYFDMIKYARSKLIWVRSTTNASLLKINENYKRIIDSDICDLQISVDGASRETYELVRKNGNFRQLVDNCVLLHRSCEDANFERTRMFVVVQHSNINELEKFPSLAAELGFKRMTFSLDLNDWGQKHWKIINDKVDVQKEVTLERAKYLIELGKKSGVEVTFWFVDEKYDTSSPLNICPWPFERSYISSDMRIVPCCMIANPDVIDIGNAQDFTEEWNNEKIVAFRRLHLSGNIPGPCRACYV